MTTNEAVAIRVTKLMKEQNMTQYRLERNAGIIHGAMDRILSCQNKTVTLATVYRLARGFNMTITEFMDDDVFLSESLEID